MTLIKFCLDFVTVRYVSTYPVSDTDSLPIPIVVNFSDIEHIRISLDRFKLAKETIILHAGFAYAVIGNENSIR